MSLVFLLLLYPVYIYSCVHLFRLLCHLRAGGAWSVEALSRLPRPKITMIKCNFRKFASTSRPVLFRPSHHPQGEALKSNYNWVCFFPDATVGGRKTWHYSSVGVGQFLGPLMVALPVAVPVPSVKSAARSSPTTWTETVKTGMKLFGSLSARKRRASPAMFALCLNLSRTKARPEPLPETVHTRRKFRILFN